MKQKKKSNYQGGKKLQLSIPDLNINEEVYYKRIDGYKIVNEKFQRITITPNKQILKRKLFVKGSKKEEEFEYNYITENGKIYDGETITAILDVEKNKIIPLENNRFIEFQKFDNISTKDLYIIEDEYIIYPTKDESKLYILAKKLYGDCKVAICKFNPNGFITGRGVIYGIKNDEDFSLLIAFGRLLKKNYIINLTNCTNKQVKKESVEFVEV